MKDRVPSRPGRRLITPESGAPYYATITRADEPVEAGTPLSAANLFSAATAAKYPSGTETVDQALAWALGKKLVATFTASGTFTLSAYGLAIGKLVDIYMAGGGGAGGASNTYNGGGGGGYCKFIKNFILQASSYSIVIGAGGLSGSGGTTTGFGTSANGGLAGKSGSAQTSAIGGDGGSGGGTGGANGMGGSGGMLGGSGSGYNNSIGGGNIDYTPVNPYNGIAYGCGGGGGNGGNGGGGRGFGGGGNGYSVANAAQAGSPGGGGGGGGSNTSGTQGYGGAGIVLIYA